MKKKDWSTEFDEKAGKSWESGGWGIDSPKEVKQFIKQELERAYEKGRRER